MVAADNILEGAGPRSKVAEGDTHEEVEGGILEEGKHKHQVVEADSILEGELGHNHRVEHNLRKNEGEIKLKEEDMYVYLLVVVVDSKSLGVEELMDCERVEKEEEAGSVAQLVVVA